MQKYSILIGILLVYFAIFPVVYAQPKDNYKPANNIKFQNNIINLNINNNKYIDIEVFIDKDETFSLPFKTTATLLGFEINQNHVTKEISYKNPEGISGTVDIKNKKILSKSKSVEKPEMIFIKNGLMDETIDEVFIPINTINEILNTDIKADYLNNVLSVNTVKTLNLFASKNNDINENEKNLNKKDKKKFFDIVKPEPRKAFTFDTLSIQNQWHMDNSTQSYLNQIQNYNYFNGNSNIGIEGSLFKGSYNLDLDTSSYKSQIFTFGGIGFKYKNKYKKINYEVGKIAGFKINKDYFCQDIWGFHATNFSDKEAPISDIEGQISPESKVNVYINDKYAGSPENHYGFFTLKELPYLSGKVQKLTIKEESSNGVLKTLKEEKFHPKEGILYKGENKISFLSGISGYQDRIFNSNVFSYDNFSKKIVAGIQYSKGVTDKLTVNTLGLTDYIISLPEQSYKFGDFIKNDKTLRLISARNFNPIQGQTVLTDINYQLNDNMKLKGGVGFSHASNISDDDFNDIKSLGIGSNIDFEYDKNMYGLNSKLFAYSPGYYIAGSSAVGSINNMNDKAGGELGGKLNTRYLNLNGTVRKYFSNLDNYFQGGKLGFNDYCLSLNFPFMGLSNLNINMNGNFGKNNIGKITNKTFEFNYNRTLSRNTRMSVNGRLNEYLTQYTNESVSSDNYSSKFKNLNAVINYNLPQELGEISLSHEINSVTSGGYDNSYNSLRIDYTFPIIFRFLPSVGLGYHYIGINKGMDISASIAYIFKSGRKLEISYQYNRVLGTFMNDFFLPSNSRHSINFNVSDVLSFVGGGVKSIGTLSENKGYIETITFLDSNKNGIQDKNEPNIPYIPIKYSWKNESEITSKKGISKKQDVSEGFYKVAVDYNSLPTSLSLSPAAKDENLVKVNKNSKSIVKIGLLSSVGNISGKINIVDEFNRKVIIEDLILIILNEKGEEIKYSTVDEDGKYSISGISPGKYTIKIDPAFIEAYNLNNCEKNITIPSVYDDFIDIKDIDLVYLQTFKP